MRLEGREKKIIVILQKGPSTSRDMSRELGVSRRTVLRDVKHINMVLQFVGAGYIESESCYQLRIVSQFAMDNLLQYSYDETCEVLLTLLTTPSVTMADVMEKTMLSQHVIRHAIHALNNTYAEIFHIDAHTGRGFTFTFFKLGPVDLLGSLCWQNKAIRDVIEIYAKHRIAVLGLMKTKIDAYRKKLRPWISESQVKIQVNVALATASFATDGQGDTLSCYKVLETFLQTKIDLYDWLLEKRHELMELATDMLSQYGVHNTQTNLASLIFDHIARMALFPTLMNEEFYKQIDELRHTYPFEFDFANIYCSAIESMRPSLLLESELCALYVMGTISRMENSSTRILLLSGRKSLELVNRSLLEQALGYTEIVAVDDALQAVQQYQTDSFDLLIRDELVHGAGLENIPWTFSYKGIIEDSDIRTLHRTSVYAKYRKSLECLLPEDNYVVLKTINNECYEDVLSRGLATLVSKGCMTSEEAHAAIIREKQGERLQFSGVAIPHCVTKSLFNNFRMFALVPTCQIQDEEETIELILIVFASTYQDDKNSIFSYLYSVLAANNEPLLKLSYSKLMSILKADEAHANRANVD